MRRCSRTSTSSAGADPLTDSRPGRSAWTRRACSNAVSRRRPSSASVNVYTGSPLGIIARGLTLFGVATLEAGGRRIVFTTDRRFQLLAYLACRRRWVRHDELADILYPERDTVHARSRLRLALLLANRV